VIVAVIPVGMMQVPVYKIVDVIPVRDWIVTAPWAMHVVSRMSLATMPGCAALRVAL
jgi:hypothetical protein